MKRRETDLISEMGKLFVEKAQELDFLFQRAFYRFYAEERMHESCASYTTPSDVFIVSALTHDDFFDAMDQLSLELINEMEDSPRLLLLTVDNNFDYKVLFEYKDMGKWRISLANGGTGIPAP